MFEHKIFTMELAGRELSVEIGKIAQCNTSIWGNYGNGQCI